MSTMSCYQTELNKLMHAKSQLEIAIKKNNSERSFSALSTYERARDEYTRVHSFIGEITPKVLHVTTMAWNIMKKGNSRIAKADRFPMDHCDWLRNPEIIDGDSIKFSNFVNNEIIFEYLVFVENAASKHETMTIPLRWIVGDDNVVSREVREIFNTMLNAHTSRTQKVIPQTFDVSDTTLRLNSKGDFAAASNTLSAVREEIARMEAELSEMKDRVGVKKTSLDDFSKRLAVSNSGKFEKIAELVLNVVRKENQKVSQKLSNDVVLEGFEFLKDRVKPLSWESARVHEVTEDSVVIKFSSQPDPHSSSVIVIPLRWLRLSDSEIIMEVRKRFKEAARVRFAKKYAQDLARMEAEAQELEKAAARLRKNMEDLIDG